MPRYEYPILTHDLDVSGKQFRFPVRAAWLRGALEGTDVRPADRDGDLDVRLSRSGRDVVVRGVLRAELMVLCARCLEPTRITVEDEVTALAVETPAHGTAHAEELELAIADADTIPFDGETVVLDDLVRDQLLLGLPMIPLCSEACAGISHGAESGLPDEALDPRLRPLMRLKKT
jgi:uncharacterized protein